MGDEFVGLCQCVVPADPVRILQVWAADTRNESVQCGEGMMAVCFWRVFVIAWSIVEDMR